MAAPARMLTYEELGGFPYHRAQLFILKRAPDQDWVRRFQVFGSFLMGFFITFLAVRALSAESDLILAEIFPVAGLVVGFVIVATSANRRRAVLRRAVSVSPHRLGARTLTMDGDGIRLESRNGTITFVWSEIFDVIEGPGGMLILLNPYEFLPLPEAAFADSSAKDGFLAEAAAYLATAKAKAK